MDKALRAGKDHLAKAEELRMRLWNLDKLERVCGALEGRMGELRIAEEVEKAYPPERIARKEKEVLAALDLHLKIRASQRPAAEARKPQRQYQQPVTDLTNILRYEKLHGPTDRDPHAPTKEMHYFKGYYLYVHDLQELHRPVLVKEFPKVPKRENGAWPQFRSSGRFRCPFVEDTPSMRERDKERERYEQYELKQGQAKRKESGRTNTEMEPRRQGEPPRPKSGEDSGAPINDARRVTQTQSALVSHGKRSIRRQENAIAFTSTNSHRNSRLTYEPVASGVQPSNITSAIRSQVVSSHRDIPGQRAGVSKEIYGLQRKVAGNALVGKHVSHPATLRKPQANPERVQPDQRTNKQSLAARTVDVTKQTGRKPVPEQAVPTTTERVPKPGYCENCRDKYEDFDTVSGPMYDV